MAPMTKDSMSSDAIDCREEKSAHCLDPLVDKNSLIRLPTDTRDLPTLTHLTLKWEKTALSYNR